MPDIFDQVATAGSPQGNTSAGGDIFDQVAGGSAPKAAPAPAPQAPAAPQPSAADRDRVPGLPGRPAPPASMDDNSSFSGAILNSLPKPVTDAFGGVGRQQRAEVGADAQIPGVVAKRVGDTGRTYQQGTQELGEGESKLLGHYFGNPGEQLDDKGKQDAKREAMGGAAKLIGSAGEAAIAVDAPEILSTLHEAMGGSIAAQVAIAKMAAGTAAGTAASAAGGKAADAMHFTPEGKDLLQSIAFFAPTLAGGMLAKDGHISSPDGENEAYVAGNGKFGVGAAKSPDAYSYGVTVGKAKVNVNIPRTAPDPVHVDAINQLDAGVETMKQGQQARAAAEQIVNGASPEQAVANQQPKAPDTTPDSMKGGVLTQQTVTNLAHALTILPEQERGQALMEAHGNLAKWMVKQGKFVGPDGTVQVVKNPDQAQQLAQKLINDEMGKHDQMRADAAQQAEQTKTDTVLEPLNSGAQKAVLLPEGAPVPKLSGGIKKVVVPPTIDGKPVPGAGTYLVKGLKPETVREAAIAGTHGELLGQAAPDSAEAPAQEAAKPETPIVKLRKEAGEIEQSMPPVKAGETRLWRGNRPGEEGQNPSFTNDLAGIALPFQKSYGGKLTHIDVPTSDLPKYEQKGGVAPGAEFIVPPELAKTAKAVGEDYGEHTEESAGNPEKPEAGAEKITNGTLTVAHTEEGQPGATGKPDAPSQSENTPERRKDSERRKAVSEMSAAEMRKELLTSQTVDLPNRRAFDEAEAEKPAPVVGMSDADGLKALNDKFGYEAGNQLLRAKADALREVGLDAYHEKGDEYLYRGVNREDVASKLEQAREILRNRIIEVKTKDGETLRFKGADFSHGQGESLHAAESELKQHKSDRETRGERARGELRGITEVGPEDGKQHEGAAEGEPKPELDLRLEDDPGQEQHYFVEKVDDAIAEGKGNATLIPTRGGADKFDPAKAIQAQRRAFEMQGWTWNAKDSQLERNGWRVWFRSQGRGAAPIAQWSRLDGKPGNALAEEPEGSAPHKAAEPESTLPQPSEEPKYQTGPERIEMSTPMQKDTLRKLRGDHGMPVNDLQKHPTGWKLYNQLGDSTLLIHPTEDHVLKFKPKDGKSGTELQRAHKEAIAYASDHPVVDEEWKARGEAAKAEREHKAEIAKTVERNRAEADAYDERRVAAFEAAKKRFTAPYDEQFYRALNRTAGSVDRWAEIRAKGATNEELQKAATNEMGEAGETRDYAIRSGKFWLTPDDSVRISKTKPTLQGRALGVAARRVLGIPEPPKLPPLDTPKSVKKGVKLTDELLVKRAQEKADKGVKAEGNRITGTLTTDQQMQTMLRGTDPKHLSVADRESLLEYLGLDPNDEYGTEMSDAGKKSAIAKVHGELADKGAEKISAEGQKAADNGANNFQPKKEDRVRYRTKDGQEKTGRFKATFGENAVRIAPDGGGRPDVVSKKALLGPAEEPAAAAAAPETLKPRSKGGFSDLWRPSAENPNGGPKVTPQIPHGVDGSTKYVLPSFVTEPHRKPVAETASKEQTGSDDDRAQSRADADAEPRAAAVAEQQPEAVRADEGGRQAAELVGKPSAAGVGSDGEPGAGRAAERAAGSGERVPESADAGAGSGAERGAGESGSQSPARVGGQPERAGDAGSPAPEPVAEAAKRIERKAHNANNYRFDLDELVDPSTMQAGGQITRIQGNIRAIKLAKELLKEGRAATKAEQKTLSEYVGWGGLPNVFDNWRTEMRKHYDELKGLLTEPEYAAARSSVLNAHYTAPDVIQGVWKLAQHLGVQGGTILEPSMGTGLFYGLMPKGISNRSSLLGVELDHITGSIAKLLYPDAQIAVKGYQDVTLPDNHLDFATGNVPFGDIKIRDGRYKPALSIHNYFFAKTLDKLKPGGVMAMLTSRYTLDSESGKDFRTRLGDQADLVGALRLPDSAFSKNAGTQVVTDLLVFRKRYPGEERKDGFLNVVETQPGMKVNEYYAAHPEHVLGNESLEGSMYRDKNYTVTLPRQELAARMDKAIATFPKKVFNPGQDAAHGERLAMLNQGILASDNVKEGAYTLHGDKIVRNEKGILVPVPAEKLLHAPRLRGAIKVREAAKELIRAQLQTSDDKLVGNLRKELNESYDEYVKKFGYLNSVASEKAFGDDPEYPLMAALEDYTPKQLARKAKGDQPATKAQPERVSKSAIFSKRTAAPYEPLTKANFPSDPKAALSRILGATGHVDLQLMAKLSGRKPSEIADELKDAGFIFQDPVTGQHVTKDEYLSGNVRAKLTEARSAAELDDSFARNIKPLEEVQPPNLTIHDIANVAGGEGASGIKPGATWIPAAAYEDFLRHLIGFTGKPGYHQQLSISRGYGEGRSWTLQMQGYSTANLSAKWAGGGVSGDDLLMLAMNQTLPTVYWKDAEGKRHLDGDRTMAARDMQGKIKDELADWATKHPTWGSQLADIYNRDVNNTVLREFDGSHLQFPGMATEVDGKPFSLRPHQANFAWRVIQEGRGGGFHVVGGGKTYMAIAAGMELRRMGLSPKNMYAVPNNKLEDWKSDFQRAYPGANVLAVGQKDFDPHERQAVMSRIATGDYDAIIVPQSHFDKMGVTPEREARAINGQLEEAREALEQAKATGDRNSRKDIEKAIQKLKERLKEMAEVKTDNAIHFDQLGVTSLFVDEAHAYKNLYFYTHMRMPGLPNAAAQRSTLMKMKTDYLREQNKGRGVIFLTGTPITNTIAELYNMNRYIAPDLLEAQGIKTFDDWVANYGTAETKVEFAADGVTMKPVTRLSKYSNLPELAKLFHSFGDIKMREDMPWIVVPKVNRSEIHVRIHPEQEAMLEDIAKRAEELGGNKPRTMRTSSGAGKEDNWLWLSGDARKISLDPRLADSEMSDSEVSKANSVAQKAYAIYKATTDNKGVQCIFSDLSKNHAPVSAPVDPDLPLQAQKETTGKQGPSFDLFKDIRSKLIGLGVQADEIAILDAEMDDKGKDKVQDLARAGKARILMGSTQVLGVGLNIQKRLKALHHLDQPWRPSDLEQREGRAIRQGNEYPEVDIIRYISVPREGKVMRRNKQTGEMEEGRPPVAYDVQLFEKLETKQMFTNQLMTNQIASRSMEDPGGEVVLDLASCKADATGNPDIAKKVAATHALTRALSAERSFQSNRSNASYMAQQREGDIARDQDRIERAGRLKEAWAKAKDNFSAVVDGKKFGERKELSKYLEDRNLFKPGDNIELYGQPVAIQEPANKYAAKAGKLEYSLDGVSYDMPDSRTGIISSVEHSMRNAEESEQHWREALQQHETDLKTYQEQSAAVSPNEAKIKQLREELSEINVRLGLNPDGSIKVDQQVLPSDELDEKPAAAKRGVTMRSAVVPGLDIAAEFASDQVAKFYKSDVAPAMNKLMEHGRIVTTKVAQVFAPRAFANPDSLNNFMAMKGEQEFSITQLEHAFRPMERMFDDMSRDAQVEFVTRIQTGKQQTTPELQQMANALSAALDGQREAEVEAMNLGRKPGVPRAKLAKRENYFPNRWATKPGAEGGGEDQELERIASIARTRSPLEGSKGYNRKQSYTLQSGIDAGGKAREYNPVRIMQNRIADGMKLVTARRMVYGQKLLGRWKFFKKTERLPVGWAEIDDKMARVFFPAESGEGMIEAGRWAMPENDARLLNNYLSRDWFRDNPLGKTLTAVKMAATSVELSFSAFHLGNVSVEAVGSQIGLGLMQAINSGVVKGDGKAFLEGLGKMATAPAAPYSMARLGGSAMSSIGDVKEFLKTERGQEFMKAFPDAPALMRDLFHGGLTTQMPREYRTQWISGLKDAAKEGNYAGVVLRAVPALAEAMMHPLFETLIPRLKTGYALQAYAQLRAENAQKLFRGDVTDQELARKAVDAAENNFGEVNYSNFFWNNTFKGALQLYFRAPSWKLTNWRSLGSAVKEQNALLLDPLKVMRDDVRGQRKGADRSAEQYVPKVSLNMARILGVAILGATLATVWDRVATGHYPWEFLEDDRKEGKNAALGLMLELSHARTGGKDSYTGLPTRINLPIGTRDYFHAVRDPRGYIDSSLAGFVSKAFDTLENRDYRDDYVYDPNGPWYQKMRDILMYNAPLPITVQTVLQDHKKGEYSSSRLGMVGLSKASTRFDMSPLERHLEDVAHSRHIPRTPEQEEAYRKKMADTAHLPAAERRQIRRDYNKPYLLRILKSSQLSYGDAKRAVDEYATPEERKELAHALLEKRKAALRLGTANSVSAN